MSKRKQSIHRTSGNLVFDQENVVRHFVPKKTKDKQKSSIAKRVEARRAGNKKVVESLSNESKKKTGEEDGISMADRIQDRKEKSGDEKKKKKKKKLSFSDILELIQEEGRQARVNNRIAQHNKMCMKQFVLDWDHNALLNKN